MKKLRLDFKNRIVSIITDKKTVIAYMDDHLKKRDFLIYFPGQTAEECTDNVTFDFENRVICLKQPVEGAGENGAGGYRCVKQIPADNIAERRHLILDKLGWKES